MYPSIKTLSQITDRAAELRSVINHTVKIPRDAFEVDAIVAYPRTVAWIRNCYHMPNRHEIRMAIADEILGTHGVELITAGHGAKSPAIEYCNAGDAYTSTLLFVRGKYRVGCWGDIVERGNYD